MEIPDAAAQVITPSGWSKAGTHHRDLTSVKANIALVRFLGIWDVDRLTYLHLMREVIDYVPNAKLGSVYEFSDAQWNRIPFYCIMSEALHSMRLTSTRINLQVRHYGDIVLTALAAERYRLAHGDWPGTLEDLVPEYLDEVPIDPYDDGKPLKMVRHKDRLVVYGIGEDGDDNGGTLDRWFGLWDERFREWR